MTDSSDFTQNPAPPEPSAPLSLLQETERAFQLASYGSLPIIELFNVTKRLIDQKHTDIATQLYSLWLDRDHSPMAYAVQFNLAVVFDNAGNKADAAAAYRSVIEKNPAFVQSYLNLTRLLEDSGRMEEALGIWRLLLALVSQNVPNSRDLYLQALNSVGRLLEACSQWSEAEAVFERSLQIDSTQTGLMPRWFDLRQKLCKWPVHGKAEVIDAKAMIALGVSAHTFLSLSDDPALQLEAARRYVSAKVHKNVHYMSSRQSYGHKHPRIAYIFSGLGSHTDSVFLAKLCALHDHAKFEVFVFFWGEKEVASFRSRMRVDIERCIDISTISDDAAACLIRAREIDILVDLQGLLPGSRHNILSYRPAPIQIACSCFCGTTALPEIDYVLTDDFSLPQNLEIFWTEKPLRLPHALLLNDFPHAIGSHLTRVNLGLPENSFVFCCFNENAKLSAAMFGAWMRILEHVPHSVLWLLCDNEWVGENLYQYAEQFGLSRARLCLTTRPVLADYRELCLLADLFLDTFPLSDGGTAGNALWAGLPVLTHAGRSCSSRMAGSLLKSLNLPELIVNDLQDYEDKAIAFGLHREKVDALKRRLNEICPTSALFDGCGLVRELEVVYRQAIDDLPATPARNRNFGDHLEYIQRPNDPPNFSIRQEVSDRRYVVAAPPFEHNSAGIRVLYELQKWLVRAGLDAIVCTWSPNYPVDQFADDIVIYPEVAPGNLLKARRVIRYVLNVPGKLGYGEKVYAENEVLIAYNQHLAPYANGLVLQVPSTEPFFNATNCVKTVDAMYVGKGQNLGLHPSDCVAITSTYPSTRKAMAQLLRSVKTLYTYDDFSMIVPEAQLCGCIVKLIRKDGQIVDCPRENFPTLDEFKIQLHEFIEMTKYL